VLDKEVAPDRKVFRKALEDSAKPIEELLSHSRDADAGIFYFT
jgi:hypothetical protein